MHHEFWQARWSRNEIGFHLAEVNPFLLRHWSALALAAGSRVLVPLCGKSLDLLWLAQQGYPVRGVELAEQAVTDFFAELGREPRVEQRGALRRYSDGDIEILQGDFFALGAADVADCRGLYDRAALIALPPEMRVAYARHLAAILPARVDGLLVTLEYAQQQMSGPPFAVLAQEVRERFAGWQVDELERLDVLAQNRRFADRGVQHLEEVAFRLRRG